MPVRLSPVLKIRPAIETDAKSAKLRVAVHLSESVSPLDGILAKNKPKHFFVDWVFTGIEKIGLTIHLDSSPRISTSYANGGKLHDNTIRGVLNRSSFGPGWNFGEAQRLFLSNLPAARGFCAAHRSLRATEAFGHKDQS